MCKNQKKSSALLSLLLIIKIFNYGENIEVQGHRGARGIRPENTLSSFQAALEAGVDAIELDLLMTQEGKVIIYHDFFIHLGKDQLVYSLSLEEIKQLDVGNKPHPHLQIPTLEELFKWFESLPHPHAKKVRLNLEIKRDPHHPHWTPNPFALAKKIRDLVKEHGFTHRVSYSSFDPEVLAELRKLEPQAKIGFIKEGDLENMVEIAQMLKVQNLSPEHVLIKDAQQVRTLQSLGFKVITWTVNDPKRWEELLEMGVDGIITDYPDELVKFLQNFSS